MHPRKPFSDILMSNERLSMKVTYIYHSGFLVETDSAAFLFDYWQGKLPERILKHSCKAGFPQSSGRRGDVPSSPDVSRLPSKPLYVFVSHSHGDHYNPEIFALNADAYILAYEMKPQISDEIKRQHNVFFLRPHQGMQILQELPDTPYGANQKKQIQILSGKTFSSFEELRLASGNVFPDALEQIDQEYISVYALASNDLGIAFAVSAPEGDIYHAGDLNNWWWDGDAEDISMERYYEKELQRIAGTHFEAAIIPYDLRLKEPGFGIRDFLKHCSTDAIYPMHVNTDREKARAAFEADPVIQKALKGGPHVYF